MKYLASLVGYEDDCELFLFEAEDDKEAYAVQRSLEDTLGDFLAEHNEGFLSDYDLNIRVQSMEEKPRSELSSLLLACLEELDENGSTFRE